MVIANNGIRDELVPENLDTIVGLVAFPAKKAA